MAMKVYVLSSTDDGRNTDIIGVFESEEKANTEIPAERTQQYSYEVTEYEVRG